jgi:hypothetical protein
MVEIWVTFAVIALSAFGGFLGVVGSSVPLGLRSVGPRRSAEPTRLNNNAVRNG